jgi:hypothetical protein
LVQKVRQKAIEDRINLAHHTKKGIDKSVGSSVESAETGTQTNETKNMG